VPLVNGPGRKREIAKRRRGGGGEKEIKTEGCKEFRVGGVVGTVFKTRVNGKKPKGCVHQKVFPVGPEKDSTKTNWKGKRKRGGIRLEEGENPNLNRKCPFPQEKRKQEKIKEENPYKDS